MHGQNPPSKQYLLHHHHLPHIPEEIVLGEILPRLPVRSLLRFRCVSKSWLSLIESDRFIKTQYQNSTKNPSWAHHRVVWTPTLYKRKSIRLEECSLRRLLKSKNEGSSSSIDDGTTTHNPPRKDCFAVGSYNGVVCLFDYNLGSFFLWNPSTRNSTQLPIMRGLRLIRKYGFGWDRSRGAYKVFAVFTCCRGTIIAPNVYSSETDSWKTLTSVEATNRFSGSGLFAGGSLHWFHHGQHDIESFDLEREVSGTIEPPDAAKSSLNMPSRLQLGEIRGSLSILFDDGETKRLVVWVMKEHGVKDSWLKLFTFPKNKVMSMSYGRRSLFGEGPNGEIFVVCGNLGFMVYSPKDDTLTEAGNCNSFHTAHVYIESLVSPPRRKEQCKADYVMRLDY